MPTLVQRPELRDVQISNLQAIDRPVDQSSLSGFLTNLLPQVSEAVGKYQQEHYLHNMSQGINDEMYGVTRDVGWLERQAYEQGKESQKVTATRASNRLEYFKTLDNMIKAKASDEEIAEMQQKFLRQSSDVINDSKLTTAVKAVQYDSNIKDNADYLKETQSRLTVAKQTTFVNERGTRAASTISKMVTATTSEDFADLIERHRTDAYAAYVSAYPDKEPSEVNAAVQKEIEGLFNFAAAGVGLDTNQRTVEFTNNLRGAAMIAVQKGFIDPTTGIEMLSASGKLDNDITTRNETNYSIELNNMVANVVSGQSVYDHNEVQSLMVRLQQDAEAGRITYEAYARMGAQLNTYTENQVDKINNRKLTPLEAVQAGYNKTEAWATLGISPEQYEAAVSMQTLSGLGTQDPSTQGLALIQRAISGDTNGEYLPNVMQDGVRKMSSQIMRYMSLDAATASKQADYGTAQTQFNNLKHSFMALDAKGSPLAMDMLAPFGDQKAYVAQIFRSGGGMHDAQNAIANPATFAQRQANLTSARDKIGTINVRPWWGLGDSLGGSIGAGMSDGGKSAWFSAVQVGIDQNPKIASQMAVGTPEALMDIISSDGTLMRDPQGYSAVIMSPRANQRLSQLYNGKDLLRVEAPKVISNLRIQVAKDHGVSPSNVIVQADATGQYIEFRPVDDNGKSKANTRTNSIVYTTDEVYRRMGIMRKESEKQKITNTQTFNTTTYGKDGLLMGAGKPYTIDTKATIGKGVVGKGARKSNVSVPSTYTTAFNGNPELATHLHTMLNDHEGFNLNIGWIKGHGTDRDGLILGNGINLAPYESKLKSGRLSAQDKAFYNKARAAQGNPQAIMEVQGEYIARFMSKQQQELAPYGVPPVTKSNYPKQFIPVQLLAADMAWHSGNYNEIKRVLKHKSYNDAVAELRKTAAYTGAGRERNARREAMLSQYYTVKHKS